MTDKTDIEKLDIYDCRFETQDNDTVIIAQDGDVVVVNKPVSIALAKHWGEHKSQAFTIREQELMAMALKYYAATRKNPASDEMEALYERVVPGGSL